MVLASVNVYHINLIDLWAKFFINIVLQIYLHIIRDIVRKNTRFNRVVIAQILPIGD